MTHVNDDDLVMHAYGEGDDRSAVEAHLAECQACRDRHASLTSDMASFDAVEAPERGERYGAEVWARIEPHLPRQRRRWSLVARIPALVSWPRLAVAGGIAVLLVAAFVAGRATRSEAPAAPSVADASPTVVKERILLIAVGDHLDRSRMVLAEIVNNPDTDAADFALEQATAADLVATNRLYRRTALESGDPAMASALEELERVLVEIANGRATETAGDLSHLRGRIESQGLIFKVTVLGAQVRQRQQDAATPQEARTNAST